MAEITLIQTDLIYNVRDDTGAYTVIITEDVPSQFFQHECFDDDGNYIEDDEKVAYIVGLIEETRK